MLPRSGCRCAAAGKLIGDTKVSSLNFSIDVVNGVVYLSGVEDTEEMNRVVSHARELRFAKQVVNYISLLADQRDYSNMALSVADRWADRVYRNRGTRPSRLALRHRRGHHLWYYTRTACPERRTRRGHRPVADFARCGGGSF